MVDEKKGIGNRVKNRNGEAQEDPLTAEQNQGPLRRILKIALLHRGSFGVPHIQALFPFVMSKLILYHKSVRAIVVVSLAETPGCPCRSINSGAKTCDNIVP